MREPEELRLPVGWGELSALAWRRPGSPRVLCLHGWMDNAASFAPLARELPEFELVALEYAGHGHSEHRPPRVQYYFFDYVFDVDAALDALGWDRCIVVGHSLGSGVAAAYACAAPERVERLAMLDGLGVLTEPPEQLPQRLARSLRSVREPRRHRRIYPSIEAAAEVRQATMPMSDRSARLLAERALRSVADGWAWRTDPRAMWNSPLWMSEDQCRAMLAAITCPVLVVGTPMLDRYLDDRRARRMECLRDGREINLEGGHHVHLDEPEAVAAALEPFIAPQEPQP